MGHRQLDATYQGARYEYAVTMCLSAISSVVQVPRPEDYGLDHICTLIKTENKLRYSGRSFGIQVKSESEKSITYGGSTENGEIKFWELDWLFERDIPFFIATVKLMPFSLKLYSTWNIWHAYWMSPQKNERQINLLLDKFPPLDDDTRWKSYPLDENYDACNVFLGAPVIEINSPNPDKDELSSISECLTFWVNFDWMNLQFRKLGIPFMHTLIDWETNNIPLKRGNPWTFWNQSQGIRETLLNTLSPMIMALEQDFLANNETDNIWRLTGINEILLFNGKSCNKQ